MLPIERQECLEKFLLSGGLSDTQTNSDTQLTSFSTETLIDALIALYDECSNSSLRRDKTISNFIDYSKTVIERLKELRLNKNDFEILKVIGRGAFGEVAFVRMKNTENIYAMKILNKWEILKRAETACYREERDVLVKGNPLWITKLHYAFQDNDNLYLVMDYYCGGDLLTLLSKFDRLTEDMARFYLAETVLAIDSLHKLGYVHRDIKPDNILLDVNGHIRLADFGSCLKMLPDGTVQSNVAVGTPDYISPEILRAMEENQGRYGPECDWWSLGIVMFEMLYGETPFYAESLVDTYGKIMNHENKFCIPNDEVDCQPVSEDAKALLKNLICNNEQRLGKNGLEDFKLHPFFKDINWDNIRQSESPYIPEVSSPYDTSNFDTEDEMKHKETLPPNKNAAFKGYHLPFIGFTYTENSLLNDCHSLLDFINIENKIKTAQNIAPKDSSETSQNKSDTPLSNEQNNEYLAIISQLETEKLELTAQLNAYQTKESNIETLTPSSIEITSTTITTINPDDQTTTEITQTTETTEIKLNLETTIDTLNEKIVHLNSKLKEYESSAKQSELEEKQKAKHVERALKALKSEKDQLFTQIFDLQERVNLQAKDLQEAQTQRKLAVQEFTDVNEKVNELRSKNVKLSNELLNKEDEIEDLKQASVNYKREMEKSGKSMDDLKSQVANFKLEAERQEFLLNSKNETSTDDATLQSSSSTNTLQMINKELETEIESLKNELDQSKDKLSEMRLDCEAKDKEIEKLQLEKKKLEDEVNLFNESKQAMSKYDWQMNEILQMVNEEKVVRGHLRSLASKLIEEVDSLRSQTAAAAVTTTPNSVVPVNTNNNGTAWKNRCSEKRERINVQNMQIALEKEFVAKEQLHEEINTLKLELDIRAHKISDLQASIDDLNKEAVKNQIDFKQAQKELLDFQQTTAADPQNKKFVNHSYEMSQQQQPLTESSSTSTPIPLQRHNSVGTPRLSNPDQENLNPTSTSNSNITFNEPSTTTPIYENAVSTRNHQLITNQKKQSETEHKFEVVTFNIIERCEFCCGILYGICRQAVKCKDKHCQYLCHPKCRQLLPTNCPININQRQLLKGVNFAQGMGTIMQGNLKVPKQGGVKKGWQDHYVFLSNARLFVFPQVDSKPSLIPSLIVDIKDPHFLVSSVNETDVIHASKRDIPCIFKMIVSKLKSPQAKQKLLFCATNEKDRNNWIMMLKDLNERLIQAAKTSANSSSIMLPIEAKEICDATSIRNAYSACVYDTERLLIASDEGIDVINIKTDCTIQRFHDKKTFLIDVFREEKLIVAISGKHHQIFLFPTIIVEGMNAEPIKIEETKSCNLFCLGKLILNSPSPNVNSSNNNSHNNSSNSLSVSSSIYGYSTRLLCVAIKKVVSIYEINSSSKPKYKKLRDIELTMMVQSMQIINNQLCIGFQSEFALYSLGQENAPIALLQPDRDKSLQFLIKDPINALMAVQISSEEYLLVFENLGVYVNIQGCRSRIEEIMWPSKPLHVAYNDPYLLCFCDRGVDVFHVKTGEWIQIMQFPKTKPLDRSGALCLCNESQDSIRLIHLKAIGEEEVISFLTKNRSLIKSKYRKGSLSRADETHLSLSNSMSNTSNNTNNHQSTATPTTTSGSAGSGSPLTYSNSNASSGSGGTVQSNSRKSLISNPINFQHIQHMGPNDGKTFMHVDPITTPIVANGGLPPTSGGGNGSATRVISINNMNISTSSSDAHYNSSLITTPLTTNSSQTSKKQTLSSSGLRQIAKNDISAPTNFRHVVKGLDEYVQQQHPPAPKVPPSPPISKSSSRVVMAPPIEPPTDKQLSPKSQLPNIKAQNNNTNNNKSASLSSSSSSSSSIILHSPPHSPSSMSNNENLSQAISNTLKATSVLYNGKLLDLNTNNE